MVRVVAQGIHHECGACHGRLEGLVPFHESLAPADGAGVWRTSKTGPCVGRCPFCHGELRAPDGDAGTAGLAVCRACEQVWVPDGAATWMHDHAPAVPPDGHGRHRDHVDGCDYCGAPFSPDPQGRCRYCRTPLPELNRVVIAVRPPEDLDPPGGGSLAGALLETLFDVMVGGF